MRSLFLCLGILGARLAAQEAGTSFEDVDRVVRETCERRQIPGAQLALVKDGRLVHTYEYGLADREAGEAVTRKSLFRIASISKTITAMAVMRLAQEGRLDLDAPAFALISRLKPPPGKREDSRLGSITVRMLLNHTGGWNRDISYDPMGWPKIENVCRELNVAMPPDSEAMVRWVRGQPLDFTPGTQWQYSNVGYLVLGEIIEELTGLTYQEFVRKEVLEPLGLSRFFTGNILLDGRLQEEVKYYDYPGAQQLPSIVHSDRRNLPRPYMAVDMPAAKASGAWMTSAIDLARLFTALDGTRPPRLISAESLQVMQERPEGNTTLESNGFWYGFGLFLVPYDGEFTYNHGGSIPGTRTFFNHRENGIFYTLLLNGDDQNSNSVADIETGLWGVLKRLESWPEHDLFPRYLPDERPSVTVDGVLNAASMQAGAIAPGETVVVRGKRLGPLVTKEAGDVERLPDMLQATRVYFNGVPAPVVSAGHEELRVLVPYVVKGLPDIALQVEYEGAFSDHAIVPVVPAAPGLFTEDGSGSGAALVSFEDDGTMVLTATGEGLLAERVEDGVRHGEEPVGPEQQVRVLLNETEVEVLSARPAPWSLPGSIQIRIRAPLDLPASEPVVVVLEIGGVRSREGVTLKLPVAETEEPTDTRLGRR